jgi:hypothetical protein
MFYTLHLLPCRDLDTLWRSLQELADSEERCVSLALFIISAQAHLLWKIRIRTSRAKLRVHQVTTTQKLSDLSGKSRSFSMSMRQHYRRRVRPEHRARGISRPCDPPAIIATAVRRSRLPLRSMMGRFAGCSVAPRRTPRTPSTRASTTKRRTTVPLYAVCDPPVHTIRRVPFGQ